MLYLPLHHWHNKQEYSKRLYSQNPIPVVIPCCYSTSLSNSTYLSLEFYTYSSKFLGSSIMIKFHHFRNFLIKIFLFNIQPLVIEMFKVINNIAATIIGDLFTTYHSCHNFRSKSKFVVPSVRTVHSGLNSIQYSVILLIN